MLGHPVTVVEVKGLEFQKERERPAQRLQIPRKTTLGLCRKNFRWWWWSYVTSRMNSWGNSKLGKWHFLMPPPSFFASSSVVILLQEDLHNWAIFASHHRCWGGGREKTQNTSLLSFFSLFVFLRLWCAKKNGCFLLYGSSSIFQILHSVWTTSQKSHFYVTHILLLLIWSKV